MGRKSVKADKSVYQIAREELSLTREDLIIFFLGGRIVCHTYVQNGEKGILFNAS